MQKSNRKLITESSIKPRVPILMTEDEKQTLQAVAKKEERSVQAMAGIIYRMGMNAYLNRHDGKQ